MADLQGLVDLLPGGLGGIQRIDELNVVQQAASGTGQQLQDLVFQLSLQSKSLFVKAWALLRTNAPQSHCFLE